MSDRAGVKEPATSLSGGLARTIEGSRLSHDDVVRRRDVVVTER